MFKQVADAPGITEAVVRRLLGDIVPDQGAGVLGQPVAPLFALHVEDLHHFVGGIILKQQKSVEPGLQARVGMDELAHQVRIPRHDHHQVVPVVLHGLEDGVDGLLSEVVFGLAVEGIGLVDKEHAAHSLFNDLLGFQRRLAHIARHQAAAVYLHQLAPGQNIQAPIDAGHHPGHHGLAGAGIAGEHQVQGHVRGGQAVLPPQLVYGGHVDQVMDLLLDGLQTDVAVQLRQQVLHVLLGQRLRGLRLLLRAAGLLVRGLFRHLIRGLFRRFVRRGQGRAPEIRIHAAQVPLRHGADHVQLLEDDLVFFIHYPRSFRGIALHGSWPAAAGPTRSPSGLR